jgi:tetratricopeptide (TPR) repeat protein
MKAKILILVLGLSFGLSTMAAGLENNFLPQDDGGSKYGKDSATCVMNLSLYRESYRQWKNSGYKNSAINDAIKPWHWCFANCPRASENIYVDGAKMFKYKIKKAKSDDEKTVLLDTLMMIYDQRIKYFPYKHGTTKPQEGYLLGRKGIALAQLNPKAFEESYNILKKSIELEKDKSKGAVMIYYFRSVVKMVKAGKLDTLAIIDTYDQLSGYIDKNINKYTKQGNEKYLKVWKNIQDNIEATFQPFANCNDLVRLYNPKFDANPNDAELLKKILTLFDKKKCVEDPLYFNAAVNLYKIEPSPESAYMIGKLLLIKKKYLDAIPYMEDATKMEDKDKVDDVYMLLANAYRSLNKFSQARNMALKALEVNPHLGQAYILIGDMYAESAKDCGSNDLTKKVAYWAAVDKFIQAKKADPELKEVANKRISIYKMHFPTTETLFFYNLKAGDKYNVGCWINETTTVRASN